MADTDRNRSGDFWEVLFSHVSLSGNEASMQFILAGLHPIQGKGQYLGLGMSCHANVL